ncbi:MAG: GNAT family N-acetyltransferase [Paludibacteraceae bacterium]
MKEIIPAVEKALLKKELTKKRFVRPTNKAHNEIYIVTAHDSPNVMREIGRLREMSFRSWGGGTGEKIDVDRYDFLEKPYKQLIVWDSSTEEIVGGYRFISGTDALTQENGQPDFVMSHLFTFNETFIKEYLPHTIELGRAFVQPDYQTSKMGTKSLFALDNLWDGLGALIHNEKKARYFIGKVTIYENYPVFARELLYEYMFKHFPDKDCLVRPLQEIPVSEQGKKNANNLFVGKNSEEDYKLLQKAVRKEGYTIPPMFNAYIGLTDTMRMFGTIVDPDFSGAYETGIMVTMDDLLEAKKIRYIDPYIDYLKMKLDEKIAQRNARKKLKKG